MHYKISLVTAQHDVRSIARARVYWECNYQRFESNLIVFSLSLPRTVPSNQRARRRAQKKRDSKAMAAYQTIYYKNQIWFADLRCRNYETHCNIKSYKLHKEPLGCGSSNYSCDRMNWREKKNINRPINLMKGRKKHAYTHEKERILLS